MGHLFKNLSIFFVIFIAIFFVLIQGIIAQSTDGGVTLGVAKYIDIKEKNVKDGTVISASDKGPIPSNTAYDPQVIGVVARDAAILINNQAEPSGVPIISTGEVYILVSTKDGNIKKGDLLTTSTIPGAAVKAVRSGYVLGTALEDYTNPNPTKVDKIVVDLNLHYFNAKPTLAGTLSDIFKIAVLPTKDSPTAIFKYFAAAGVVLGSFVLGFMSFGRTAAKGVEALGRNPSASKIIYVGIVFNISVVVAIVLAGLTVAFLILRL